MFNEFRTAKTHNIIVGTTTAYPLSPNEFREAIIANQKKIELKNKGIPVKLILINDDIDALTSRHLKLIKKEFPTIDFEKYLGRPIYAIPSPSDEFKTLSDYYLNKYLQNIEKLKINFDEVINSKNIRKTKEFKKIANSIIKKKKEIIKLIKEEFGLDYSSKFLKEFDGKQYVNIKKTKNIEAIKFPWSIECFIRWELVNANTEPFAKNYLTKPLGSFHISSKIYTEIFDGKTPNYIKYEPIKYKKEQLKLFKTLPGHLFNKLLLANPNKNSYINEKSQLQLIKKEKVADTDKTWFEAISFLKEFEKQLLFEKQFQERIKKHYFNSKIIESEFIELIKVASEYKEETLIKEKIETEQGKTLLKQKLKEIIELKNKQLDLSEFKKEFNNITRDFRKEEFVAINKLLFRKSTGIPFSTAMFFLSKRNIQSQISDSELSKQSTTIFEAST